MTKPRQILPNQVVLLTRRTDERRFFLRPDTQLRRLVDYELAKAAERSSMTVHGLMTMCNHPHIVATDNRGERSDFMRDFCSGVARSRNHHLDRAGHFWDPQQFGNTALLDRQAIEEKLLYTWLNPVTANLVERAEHWPGPKILPRDWGKPRTVVAPAGGFHNRKKAKLILFTPMPPPGYEHMTLPEVIEYFETKLREAEDRLMHARRRSGKRVFGIRKLLAMEPLDGPTSRARRGKLNPRFATKNGELMARAQAEHRAFQDSYAAAYTRWRRGDREVAFPAGTVRLRKIAPVTCLPPTGREAAMYHKAA